MPNDCWNHVTLYAPADIISRLVDAKERFVELVAAPPTGTEATTWFGSDRFYSYGLDQVGKEAIQFRFISAWSPPVGLFERLLRELPAEFLKVTWSVEDGAAGIWVGERTLEGAANGGYLIQSIHWDEGCLEEKAHRWR